MRSLLHLRHHDIVYSFVMIRRCLSSSTSLGSTERSDRNKPRIQRINEKIGAKEVTVIDEHGKKVSDNMKLKVAIEMAQQRNMDLVEVSSTSDRSICKFISSKERYEKDKKVEKLRKEALRCMEKEFQFGSNIADYDLMMRLERVKAYLEKGYTMKLFVNLRRTSSNPEIAKDKQAHVLEKIEETLKSVGQTMNEPRSARGGRALEVIWRLKSKTAKSPSHPSTKVSDIPPSV
jgi:translation initiation factor IF-3